MFEMPSWKGNVQCIARLEVKLLVNLRGRESLGNTVRFLEGPPNQLEQTLDCLLKPPKTRDRHDTPGLLHTSYWIVSGRVGSCDSRIVQEKSMGNWIHSCTLSWNLYYFGRNLVRILLSSEGISHAFFVE